MSENNGKRVKTVKGFDENLRCRDFQYEVGGQYKIENDDPIMLCHNGFHAIAEDRDPISVFKYYPPAFDGKRSRYCKVEVGGKTDTDGDKIVGSEIKVGPEIGVPGIIKAHIDWVKSRTTNKNSKEVENLVISNDYVVATAGDNGAATAGDNGAATAGNCGAATAGNCGAATVGNQGAATAGDYGAATAGDYGAATASDHGGATAGYRGAATAGDYGTATAGEYGTATSRGSVSVGTNGIGCVRGANVKIKGGLGAILMIAVEESNTLEIKEWKTIVVDGQSVKENTWYTLENGNIIEAENTDNTKLTEK